MRSLPFTLFERLSETLKLVLTFSGSWDQLLCVRHLHMLTSPQPFEKWQI